MYTPEARKFVKHITVAQLCRYLIDHVPANAVVHICGNDWLYFHQKEDGSIFNMDDSSLSDLPAYENSEPEEVCF